ncbi:hypothetical protein J2790_000015 [Paenarthrobacter nicotinovorans]|uniref:hypothetical protein n=1 Tax=Micrococcaceae TaxID=1268 RepID=UPI0008761D0C|nr:MULTISPECIES: hypothetical protein [Micrococcaceae]MDR6434894.1 hypothetical protein [Paenarthrobacter nicotinovorans]SCZ59462.1 hypothetical protein SAMN02799638_02760 [Arthrobacter sp. UNCCL28]
MEIIGFMPPDEFWAMSDQLDQEVRAGADVLPVFTLTDWEGSAMLGSWLSDGSEGSVAHGDAFGPTGPLLEVVTTNQDPHVAARNRWRASAGIPHNLEELQRQDAMFNALANQLITITVDDADTDFTLWLGTGSWLAAGTRSGFGIVINAQRNPPPPEAVSLRRVPDVEPLLQARRAALKKIRGEA